MKLADSRVGYVAMEAVRGFRRNLLLAVSMTTIVAISLTLLGLALMAGKQAQLYQGYWYNKIEVSVFLNQNVTPVQRAAIDQRIAAVPVVQHIYYESQQEAFAHFVQEFKNSPAMVRNVTAAAMPQSFRVKLTNATRYAQVRSALCPTSSTGHVTCQAGVAQVVDQRQIVNRLFEVLDLFRNSFYVLAAVLGMAALVLIAVTVRVAAFARRRETQIMRLVGASSTYIRLPFLAEGAMAGLIGSLIALGLMRGGLAYLLHVRNDVTFLQTQPMIGNGAIWSSWFILLAVGIVVPAVASVIALRRYVRI